MSEPFTGEIQCVAHTYPRQGWAACDGQVMDASQHAALHALLGVRFGGNATRWFKLPDLQGRVPLGQGFYRSPYASLRYDVGDQGGAQDVTLSSSQLPAHTHPAQATENPGTTVPINTGDASLTEAQGMFYSTNTDSTVQLNSGMILAAGGGSAHTNLQPYQVLLFCIALNGVFPQRN